jgi:hypothetical protein
MDSPPVSAPRIVHRDAGAFLSPAATAAGEACYHVPMPQRHKIAMLMLHEGSPRDLEAREQLGGALPDAEISEPDEVGVFEIGLDADDQEQALLRVWDAVAAAGVDDHVAFLEHPNLPDHWRPRSRRPAG